MTDGHVEVVGLRTLLKTLKQAEVDLDELKVATDAAQRIVLRAAVAAAPRRSGKLAESGRGVKQRRRAVITFGSARVPYAGPIHWGWPARNIAAQPFASLAAQDTESEWVDAYAREVTRIIEEVHGA